MSGLLRLASCSAFSPAATAIRSGPAARSAPGTPSVALFLSAGVHLVALAVFLLAASRSGVEESGGIEIRAFLQPPGILLTPPPPPPAGAQSKAPPSDVGRVVPVPKADPEPEDLLKDLLRSISPEKGAGTEPAVPARGGGGGAPTPTANHALTVDPDLPTDRYDEHPVVVSAPEPDYPPIALDAGIEGRVVVEALVGRDGRVRRVVVKEGNPMLAESAQKAVRAWRFKPARWRGEAVTAWVAVPVVFRIH